ncbi:Retrovirus-related Pol polyprotein from transposon TNT 1-94 [Gossypium australe]|uniref:Retrovirus-related Pol polyprotein from transposon TNT 1-94 n=1 Tax=Gossypium australe TaxID=47621 RepID=A0A5B6VVR3_9ROSI|nr:Retrovirus-related Pol polyprotein from transposon TNT 1-94 [Gossypium australe]
MTSNLGVKRISRTLEFFQSGESVFNTESTEQEDDDSLTYDKAMQIADSKLWEITSKAKINSMYSNSVWELVDLPEGIKPIECKWIYKRKINADGKVETYKTRLVAKGYTQKEGIDYEKTFSPVAMLKSISILLSITTTLDYEIWQMDVKTTFLNDYLEDNIYMCNPLDI